MKKYLIYGLLILFYSIKLISAEKYNFFIWEMKDPEYKNTTYLLGSIHLGNEKLFPLPQKILGAFDKSEILVLEINLNNIDPFAIAQKAMYFDGRTLEGTLSQETFNNLSIILESSGFTKEIYNKFKPWFAAMVASISEYTEEGLSSEYGIDTYFLKKANENNIPVDELESTAEQINIFDSLPESLNNLVVEYILTGSPNGSSKINELIDAYINGDEKKISKFMIELENDTSEISELFKERLLTNRNLKMADKIDNFHKSGKIHFVIAGTAHFLGKDGIIEILKNKNYIIKRL